MNEQVFTILITTYSIVLTAVVAALGKLIKDHFKANSNAKKTDMLMLRVALIFMHDIILPEGKITRSKFITFEEIWELYHTGYNGNTLTDKFHEEIKELPIEN